MNWFGENVTRNVLSVALFCSYLLSSTLYMSLCLGYGRQPHQNFSFRHHGVTWKMDKRPS